MLILKRKSCAGLRCFAAGDAGGGVFPPGTVPLRGAVARTDISIVNPNKQQNTEKKRKKSRGNLSR